MINPPLAVLSFEIPAPTHIHMQKNKSWFWIILALLGTSTGAFASEADINIPPLDTVSVPGLGGVSGPTLMYLGLGVCVI
ncbi:MAG: K(+)-insensitive pyrophosphate-energized proton pump, partial [Pedosphaera sp.]|nr:K(+)-insensitive pyrophosphate-energized proton pump [Pedosphaera sp.]